MIVFHMSETLKLGDTLDGEYQDKTELISPFVKALEKSTDCFYAMLLNGKYVRAVMRKSGLREWSNYVKWSAEGAFEYIRKTEFPHCCSRVVCNYFYDSLPNCKRLFDYDWGEEPDEVRNAIRLYEVELEDKCPQRCDMRLFDEAYDAMEDEENLQKVLDLARRYFAGGCSDEPIWELMSIKPARATKDISDFLRNER